MPEIWNMAATNNHWFDVRILIGAGGRQQRFRVHRR